VCSVGERSGAALEEVQRELEGARAGVVQGVEDRIAGHGEGPPIS
jgi:hypothetical protein